MRICRSTLGLVLTVFTAISAAAQNPPGIARGLARAAQDPFSDLTHLPFNTSFLTGGELPGSTVARVEFEPLLPFDLGDVDLIVQPTLPYQSVSRSGGARTTGLTDIELELWITPSETGSFVWGGGPVFSFPTATTDLFRTGSWAVGPGIGASRTTKRWVFGGLLYQYWTFAHDEDHREVSRLTLEPFVNYNFGDGWAVSSAPVITADWNSPFGEWTVPIGFGFSKVTAIGQRPLQLSLEYYYNVERPLLWGSSQLQFGISLLYPRAGRMYSEVPVKTGRARPNRR